MNNQFTNFCRFLSAAKYRKWMQTPRNIDVELIETLFWDESQEALANRILRTLLDFQHQFNPLIWKATMNLLLGARNAEEKEASLCLLDAFA